MNGFKKCDNRKESVMSSNVKKLREVIMLDSKGDGSLEAMVLVDTNGSGT